MSTTTVQVQHLCKPTKSCVEPISWHCPEAINWIACYDCRCKQVASMWTALPLNEQQHASRPLLTGTQLSRWVLCTQIHMSSTHVEHLLTPLLEMSPDGQDQVDFYGIKNVATLTVKSSWLHVRTVVLRWISTLNNKQVNIQQKRLCIHLQILKNWTPWASLTFTWRCMCYHGFCYNNYKKS